jgi:predicted ATPase
VAGGLVYDGAGRWIEEEALDWARLPSRVEAVIAWHVGRLPAAWRETLAIASVEGDVFTAEVVARVQGLDASEVRRRLSGPLAREHAMVMADSVEHLGEKMLSRYRFRHHLFQVYLYGRLDAVTRGHLHQAVGATLEALHAADATALAAAAPRLAFHFEAAGLVDKALDYL